MTEEDKMGRWDGKVEQRCVTKAHTGNPLKNREWSELRRGKARNCQIETYCTVYSTPAQ